MPIADFSLDELETKYRLGHYGAVVSAFEGLSAAGDSFASVGGIRQVAAQSYVKLGNASAAIEQFVRAAAAHVEDKSINASVCFANAVTLLRHQRADVAAEYVALSALAVPVECDVQPAVLRELVSRYSERNDWLLTAAVLAAASAYPSTRTIALSTLLDLASRDGLVVAEPAVPVTPLTISIIVCSIDDARFTAFSAECERAFSDGRYELIRIADAKSMCEGYNRGMAAATGEAFIFCHDDIEFLFDGGANRLTLALQNADVLFCVGGSEIAGPSWINGRRDRLHGWMAVPADGGQYLTGIVGPPDAANGIRSGDGCFIACRASVGRSLPWDEASFTRFHMYDVDFSAQASAAGLRVQMAGSLPVSHRSGGSYDESWQAEAQIFCAKYDVPFRSPPSENPWCTALAQNRETAHRRLAALDALLPSHWRRGLASQLERLAESAQAQRTSLRVLDSLVRHS